MLKIGSAIDDLFEEHLGHPWAVAVYKTHALSHVVGPFSSFADAQNYLDTHNWIEDEAGVVYVLYPPEVT